MDNLIHNERKNTGLVFEKVQAQDWILGGVSPLQNKVIFSDGHGWPKFRTPPEMQFNTKFDSFSCVVFACLKALCMYIYCVYGILLNLDEMFTAVMARVQPGVGTSVRNVLECIRKSGVVEQALAAKLRYPFDANTTEAMYFNSQPYSLIKEALKFLNVWKMNWEALTTSDNVPHAFIGSALQFSPVISTGFAWIKNSVTGLYVDEGRQANHCWIADDYAGSKIIANDTYPSDNQYDTNSTIDEFIKELDPSYRIFSAHKITAEPILPTNVKNSLLNKLTDMLSNLVRDIHGGFHFIKNGKREKLPDYLSPMMTVLSVNFGIQQAKDDAEIQKYQETTEFFPVINIKNYI
jgi:hypothetical protein